MSKRDTARALSAEIDRLLAGRDAALDADGFRRADGSVSADGFVSSDYLVSAEELGVARRLSAIVASFPPVPAGLERRVQEIVRLRPVAPASRRGWRWAPTTSTLGTAVVSALATALVFLAVLIFFPAASGGQRSWAQMIDVLLGQTRVRVTPTLQAGSTFVSQTVDVASLTPVAGGALAEPGLPRRELLRDLVAAELLIGRAPSTPKTLPQDYALLEISAVSYPDLPSWISQPFYVELCYGAETVGSSPDLRLRQYRLLFRELGGISGVQVASGAVQDMEQVDVGGATGMLLTFDSASGALAGRAHPTYTLLWERDGLLLELETGTLSQEHLLEIARSVR